MTLTADLALVTACRDALDGRGTPWKFPHRRWPDMVMTKNGCLWRPDGRTGSPINDPADGAFLVGVVNDALPAALSLIEDTLNRHVPDSTVHAAPPDGEPWQACGHCDYAWPCVDLGGALAALHTIATALGVDQ